MEDVQYNANEKVDHCDYGVRSFYVQDIERDRMSVLKTSSKRFDGLKSSASCANVITTRYSIQYPDTTTVKSTWASERTCTVGLVTNPAPHSRAFLERPSLGEAMSKQPPCLVVLKVSQRSRKQDVVVCGLLFEIWFTKNSEECLEKVNEGQ